MHNILIFLVIVFIPSVIPGMKTQQNQALPACLPVAESLLVAMEGRWTVHWTYRTAPGQFVESVAQSRIQQDLLGCALIERFEGTLNEVPFNAITLFSHAAEGQFDRVRIDSEHGAFTRSEGHVEGDSLVFVWQRPMEERVLRTRHSFFDFTASAFTVEFYLSRSADAPWELVQRARYERRSEED